MIALVGALAIFLSVWLVRIARPAADGTPATFLRSEFAGTMWALLCTTMLAFGIAFLIYGIATLGG